MTFKNYYLMQAILFDVRIWNSEKIKKWLRENKFGYMKTTVITKNYVKYTLKDPINKNGHYMQDQNNENKGIIFVLER